MLLTQSLRARFGLAAVTTFFLLATVIGFAYSLVESNAQETRQRIRSYYGSHKVLRDAKNSLHNLEVEIRHHLIVASKRHNEKLLTSLNSFDAVIKSVLDEPLIKDYTSFAGIVTALTEVNNQLNVSVHLWLKGQAPPASDLVDRLRKLMHLMERRFYDSIIDHTYQTLDASDILNKTIWLMSTGTFIILMFAYALFELSIRRPLMLVAAALKAEGRGEEQKATPPKPRTIEIRFLVDAFNSMRQQIRSRQQRLNSVLESTSDGIITFDWEGHIESINGAGETLFGVTRENVIGRNIADIMPLEHFTLKGEVPDSLLFSTFLDQQGDELEAPIERTDGTTFQLSLKLSEFYVGKNKHFNALVSDISERKSMIDQLKFLARRDSLTGLVNRHRFFEELQGAVNRRSRERETRTGVISIDLDRFKYINDSMGHHAGDVLLKDIAGILLKRCRKSDILARLGGDEFVVLFEGANQSEAAVVAEDYRKSLANYPFSHDGDTVEIACSIGVAMLNDDIEGPEELMARADLAMRMAKQAGRNRVQFFEKMSDENRKKVGETENYSYVINEALRNNLFYPIFEPIVDVASEKIVGYETLTRLKPTNNFAAIPIGTLISSAERFGLAVDIDRRVVSMIFDLLKQKKIDLSDKWLSINLSAQSIGNKEIISIVRKIRESNLAPEGTLVFELTETAAIGSLKETQIFLKELASLGCKSALDDFGTGYATFSCLRELPVDFIKLDQGYVQDLHTQPIEIAMIKGIHAIATAMGASTIAEGVEKKAEFEALKKIGVNYSQGYLFGKAKLSLSKPKHLVG